MREFWLRRVAPRLETDRGLWLGVFAFCVVVYTLTARWSGQANDAMAAAWPAWTLAHHGTLHLDTVRGVPDCIWFVHAHGHLVSNRMIGVILVGVPVNLLLGWTGLPAEAAGAITAILVTAVAMATMAVIARRIVGLYPALAAIAVLAFGTATWTVASKELWTHGPDAMWLALAVLALSRRRYLLAGLAFAPAMLVRPHLVVVALVAAVTIAALERRLAPLLTVPPAVGGLGLLAALNHAIFGTWSLSGGYGLLGYSAGQAAAVGGHGGVLSQLTNQVNLIIKPLEGALFSPWDGLFLYTPVALVALLAIPFGLRTAPRWATGAAFGGIAYELAQGRVNPNFTGGNIFFSNRLVIESLVLCLPLMAFSVAAVVRRWPRLLPVVASVATLSVAIHAAGAILSPWLVGINDPWSDWYLAIVLRAAGPDGIVVAAVGIIATVTAAIVASAWQRGGSFSSGVRPESSARPVGWASEPVQTV